MQDRNEEAECYSCARFSMYLNFTVATGLTFYAFKLNRPTSKASLLAFLPSALFYYLSYSSYQKSLIIKNEMLIKSS